MAAERDTIRTREPSETASETHLARVDVSGLRLADVSEFVCERSDTPVYVEHRGGSTYLVAEDA
jgi:hypothetical protein